MYIGLQHSHSLLRYFVLALLVILIIKALMGWLGNKPYGKTDNKLMLWTMIVTHLQLLIGLFLYFVSPYVKFGSDTMSDATLRYWTVEHVSMMAIAIALITIARATSKKLTEDIAKHKRVFIFNALALVIILVAISMSGRGIIIPT